MGDIVKWGILLFICWLVFYFLMMKLFLGFLRWFLPVVIVAGLIVVGIALGPESGGISVVVGIALAGWYLLGRKAPT